MTPLMFTLGIAVAPAVLLSVLRINAVIVLLSLCLGDVLIRLAGNDASSFVGMFTANTAASSVSASLILLLIPPVFVSFILIGTVHGKLRTLLNIVPAVAVGAVGLLLAVPQLSPGLRGTIEGSIAWHDLQLFQALIISLATIVSMAFLLFQRSAHVSRPGKHRGHH